MTSASAKLADEVAALRARAAAAAAAEDAANGDAAAAQARLRALAARKSALDADAAAAAAALATSQRFLRNATAALAAQAARLADAEEAGAAATQRRDELRAERGRLAEEAAARKRQLAAALRQAMELNATVRAAAEGEGRRGTWAAGRRRRRRRPRERTLRAAHPASRVAPPPPPPPPPTQLSAAKAHAAATRSVKAALEASVFDLTETLRAANSTLRAALRLELPRARAALAAVRAEAAAARRAAARARADLAVRAAAFNDVSARLGRAPDLAIGDAADGLDAATVAALVAGGEARRQAAEGAFRPEDDIAEFVRERTLGEEPLKTPARVKPPAAVAAAPPLRPVVSQ
jgi:hypothetical protein